MILLIPLITQCHTYYHLILSSQFDYILITSKISTFLKILVIIQQSKRQVLVETERSTPPKNKITVNIKHQILEFVV